MKQRIKKLLVACLALGTGLFATSCFEEGWDIDDVDLTVGTTIKDLTIPVGSTGGLYLKNIIDLEEDGVVQVVNKDENGEGMYCVKETGAADIPPVEIEKISTRPEIDPIDASLRLYYGLPGGNSVRRINNKQKINISALGNLEIPEADYYYEIIKEDTKYTLKPTTVDDLSSDLIDITHVTCVDNTVFLRFTIVGLPDFVTHIRAKSFHLTVPEGFEYSEAFFEGDLAEFEKGVIKFTGEEGKLVKIKEEDGSLNELFVGITLTGLKETEPYFVFDKDSHIATFQGDFCLSGFVGINTKDLNEEILNKEIKGLIAESSPLLDSISTSKSIGCLLPKEIVFKGEANFEKDIVVESFAGVVKHDVDDIAPIKLDDMPDFLDEDGVVLDLDNPMLFITAKNGLPAEAKTSITLRSVYKDKAPKEQIIEDVTINGNGVTTYCFSARKGDYIPEGYEHAVWREFDLSYLIKEIPEKIEVEIAPVMMDTKGQDVPIYSESLDRPITYDVDVNYEIFAPLAFGPEFKLIYSGTESGLSEDMSDLEDVENLDGSITVNAMITSSLNASLILTVTPLDKNGNVIEDLTDIATTIPANATDYEFAISLATKNGKSLSDILLGRNGAQQLDGITYKATIEEPVTGAVMRTDDSIRLHNIKLTLNAKASVDIDEL